MISFKNIQVAFGDFIAIHDLNLNIRKGEFFTFLGPSGCGKTTTLRTLVGFIKPVHGTIMVEEKNIVSTPVEDREIGMVFQSYALFPTMSVYDNIAFGLNVKKEAKSAIKERVHELAMIVDLSNDQLHRKVSDLSGGQQQRVAIARALAVKPKILVLDEPLSNLDARLRKQLRKELKNLQHNFGITTIYVTHDQEEALTLSDRIAIFNEGHIEQVGTPEEIYDKSKTEFVCHFVGDANLLSKEVLQAIHQQTAEKLDVNKKSYIRPEKIRFSKPMHTAEEYVALEGQILHKEFFGSFSQYHCRVLNTEIICIEKEDGTASYAPEDRITLYVQPKYILQYKGVEQ